MTEWTPEYSSYTLGADIFLHDVTTLKSVEIYNWWPEQEFTPPDRVSAALSCSRRDAL